MTSTSPKLVLSIQNGSRADTVFEVPAGQVRTVGRTHQSNVAIEDDNFMSGIHFEVENFGVYAEVRDQRSTNKTWLNNEVITSSRLSTGDIIRAGKTFFAVEWERYSTAESLASEKATSPPNRYDSVPVRVPAPVYAPAQEYTPSPSDSSERAHIEPDRDSPLGSLSANFFKHQALNESSFPSNSAVDSPISHSVHDFPLSFADSHVAVESKDSRANESRYPSSDSRKSSYGSPLDSSSVFGPSRKHQPEKFSANGSGVLRLRQNKNRAKQSDIGTVILRLAQTQSVFVIVHFRKIGLTTPVNFRIAPVFPEINDHEHMPVIVEAKEWLSNVSQTLSGRLIQADGMMVVVTSSPSRSLEAVQGLGQQAVPGFSERGGFLGWCWPSQMLAISSQIPNSGLFDLMGESVLGFVFGFPAVGDGLMAISKPDLRESLSALGFE